MVPASLRGLYFGCRAFSAAKQAIPANMELFRNEGSNGLRVGRRWSLSPYALLETIASTITAYVAHAESYSMEVLDTPALLAIGSYHITRWQRITANLWQVDWSTWLFV